MLSWFVCYNSKVGGVVFVVVLFIILILISLDGKKSSLFRSNVSQFQFSVD